MEYLHWFEQSPILGFILLVFLCHLIAHLINRTSRLIMVLLRGWPTVPLMDANGDVVYPKAEKEEE